MEAAEDEHEEDGGEDPEGDGHEHHPAVHRRAHEDGAGDQRPVDQAQELQPDTERGESVRHKRMKCPRSVRALKLTTVLGPPTLPEP